MKKPKLTLEEGCTHLISEYWQEPIKIVLKPVKPEIKGEKIEIKLVEVKKESK